MASDRVQYRQALNHWDALQQQQRFSVPPDEGTYAILCSDYGLGNTYDGSIEDERRAFAVEGQEIAASLTHRGIPNKLFQAYTLDDARTVLADPKISSVITIGNGNLSETYCTGEDYLDWQFVAVHTTHLKTGRFVQRHCGHCAYDLSVPLGTFALADHSNVFAAYGNVLPTEMTEADEELIQRVHTERRLTYAMVKLFFQKPWSEDRPAASSSEDAEKSDVDS